MTYETPVSKALELAMHGVLCTSTIQKVVFLDQVLDQGDVTQKDSFGDSWTWDD